MENITFLSLFGFVLINFFGWGFKHLPGERWQMLAVVPLKKADATHWQGANLTYYGFFIATSQLLSLSLLIILLRSMQVPLSTTIMALALVLV